MKQSERRRYVRIEDRLFINVRHRNDVDLQPDLHSDRPQALQADMAQSQSSTPFEQLAYQFQHLDNQLSTHLNRARAKHQDLAEALSVLNQKINIAFQSTLSHTDDTFYAYTDISISACGISVVCEQQLQLGDEVQVSLLLPPFNCPFTTDGTIIEPCDQRNDRLRIDFINLSNEQEEILIQYVIRRQNTQLIQARERKLQDNN
ncbi:MAG: PilZ domain-containing protein [Gammaproteobacteria bacterium]|jgi:hypothetical protein